MATESINISIDSRFRDAPNTSTESDFIISLPESYRNVTRTEIVSAEIPIYSHSFSTNETTIFQVRPGPDESTMWVHQPWQTIILPTGNYTASILASEIQSRAGIALGFSQTLSDTTSQGFVVNANETTGRILMEINMDSTEWIGTNDISSFDINLTPVDLNIAYSYGVSHGDISVGTTSSYLEEQLVYASAIRSWAESLRRGEPVLRDILGFTDFLMYGLSSYTAIDHFGLYGYPYLLLQVNDYEVIDHITGGSIIRCFAKLSLDERGSDNGRANGGGYAFQSDSAISFPKVFDQPENIARLQVRLLTPMGEIVDLLGANLSFTMRIQHIRDSRRYDQARDAYIPAGSLTNYKSDAVLVHPDKQSSKQKLPHQKGLRNGLRNVRFSK